MLKKVMVHLVCRLTTDLAQRRRDAEKIFSVLLGVSAPLREKNITKQAVTNERWGEFLKKYE
jgi:hypothetical protein